MTKKFFTLFILIFVFISYSYLPAQWEPIGPFGGFISCITSRENIISAMGYRNIYKSTDYGNSWITKISDVSITFQPDGIPFLLDRGDALFLFSGYAIYKSTNEGKNWQFRRQWDVAFNKMLYKDSALYICNGSIFKSTNDGYNWIFFNGNLPQNQHICDLIIAGNNFYSSGYRFIAKSTDKGNNWVFLSVPDTSHYYSTLCYSGNKIFVISTDYNYYNSVTKIYKTSNDGINWISCFSGLPDSVQLSNFISNNNTLYLANSINTQDPIIIIKSTDEGSNWSSFNNGLDRLYHCTFTVSGDYTILGSNSDKGIFRSKPEENLWINSSNGISGKYVNNLIFTGSEMYASLPYSGLYKSVNQGNNWTNVESYPYMTFCIYSVGTYPNNVLLSGSDSCIYYSTNNGGNWVKANTPASTHLNNVNNFYYKSPAVYAGTSGTGILKSTDNGKNWIFRNTGIQDKNILCIYGYQDTLFAGTGDGTYVSVDKGNSWVNIFSNFNTNAIIADKNRLLVSNAYDLYYTTNLGLKWIKINSMHFRGFLKVQKSGSGSSDYLLGWTYDSIFISIDSGNHWNSRSDNLPISGFENISLDGNYLYLCTSNASIWRGSLSETIFSPEANSYKLFQNYPNPFNSTTKIGYKMPFYGRVRIEIFDILGRRIKEVINTMQNAGQYEVSIDGSSLSSGIYFYQLRAGDFVETKKMLLIK
jgi:photosystem II stability/assembly factor-like uncharacterized protein